MMDYLSVTPMHAAESDDMCPYEVVNGDARYPCHLFAEHDGPHLIDADVVVMLVKHEAMWQEQAGQMAVRAEQLEDQLRAKEIDTHSAYTASLEKQAEADAKVNALLHERIRELEGALELTAHKLGSLSHHLRGRMAPGALIDIAQTADDALKLLETTLEGK